MARLVLNYEGVGLVTHELVDDIAMIGRAPSNHLVIDHPTVSAQHALFLKEDSFSRARFLDPNLQWIDIYAPNGVALFYLATPRGLRRCLD
jgi:hypothetical protein